MDLNIAETASLSAGLKDDSLLSRHSYDILSSK